MFHTGQYIFKTLWITIFQHSYLIPPIRGKAPSKFLSSVIYSNHFQFISTYKNCFYTLNMMKINTRDALEVDIKDREEITIKGNTAVKLSPILSGWDQLPLNKIKVLVSCYFLIVSFLNSIFYFLFGFCCFDSGKGSYVRVQIQPHQFLEPHSHHELIHVFLHLGLNDCTHPIPTEPPYHTDPLTLLVSFVLESIKLVCVSYQTIETQIPYLLYRDLFHFRGSDCDFYLNFGFIINLSSHHMPSRYLLFSLCTYYQPSRSFSEHLNSILNIFQAHQNLHQFSGKLMSHLSIYFLQLILIPSRLKKNSPNIENQTQGIVSAPVQTQTRTGANHVVRRLDMIFQLEKPLASPRGGLQDHNNLPRILKLHQFTLLVYCFHQGWVFLNPSTLLVPFFPLGNPRPSAKTMDRVYHCLISSTLPIADCQRKRKVFSSRCAHTRPKSKATCKHCLARYKRAPLYLERQSLPTVLHSRSFPHQYILMRLLDRKMDEANTMRQYKKKTNRGLDRFNMLNFITCSLLNVEFSGIREKVIARTRLIPQRIFFFLAHIGSLNTNSIISTLKHQSFYKRFLVMSVKVSCQLSKSSIRGHEEEKNISCHGEQRQKHLVSVDPTLRLLEAMLKPADINIVKIFTSSPTYNTKRKVFKEQDLNLAKTANDILGMGHGRRVWSNWSGLVTRGCCITRGRCTKLHGRHPTRNNIHREDRQCFLSLAAVWKGSSCMRSFFLSQPRPTTSPVLVKGLNTNESQPGKPSRLLKAALARGEQITNSCHAHLELRVLPYPSCISFLHQCNPIIRKWRGIKITHPSDGCWGTFSFSGCLGDDRRVRERDRERVCVFGATNGSIALRSTLWQQAAPHIFHQQCLLCPSSPTSFTTPAPHCQAVNPHRSSALSQCSSAFSYTDRFSKFRWPKPGPSPAEPDGESILAAFAHVEAGEHSGGAAATYSFESKKTIPVSSFEPHHNIPLTNFFHNNSFPSPSCSRYLLIHSHLRSHPARNRPLFFFPSPLLLLFPNRTVPFSIIILITINIYYCFARSWSSKSNRPLNRIAVSNSASVFL
ncbi:hypothetical protein VP01_100g2 [Puccinia sorghi]|uniref:Uncharacterized protein n=1 Tax=Puccinia sorghi TaxID=27349 RepID=A0A0L6VV25_9BASI|nr:hypothetical protein VP01_100g2 [Puccinia sorghi]